MKTPIHLAILLYFAAITSFAAELEWPQRDCAFVSGQAWAASEWFLKSGRAEVTVANAKWEAKLYATDHQGDLSHTVQGKLTQGDSRRGRERGKASGKLVTLGSDAGDSEMEGQYYFARWKDGAGPAVNWSITIQDGSGFVSITCYARPHPGDRKK